MSDNNNMNDFGVWLVRNKRRLAPAVFLALFMMSLTCPNDKDFPGREEAFRKLFVICSWVFFYKFMQKISNEVNERLSFANGGSRNSFNCR